MKTMRQWFLAVCFLGTMAAAPLSAAQFGSIDNKGPALSAEDYFRLAKQDLALKDFPKAKEDLRRGLAIQPFNVQAKMNLAWVLNELQEYDDALTVCDEVLAGNADNVDAWREKGYALLQKGDNNRGVEALVRAISLNRLDRTVRTYLKTGLERLERQGQGVLAAQWREKVKELDGASESR
jgi:tetratricopeptide (TPR) repeat protein